MPFSPIDANGGLTHARLLEAVHYDQDTGLFTWLIPGCGPGGGGVRGIGKRAGRISQAGYIRLSIDGVRYRAHRLAWFYMTGEWPALQVDHKNGVRHDNRWRNLRLATQVQNSANMRRRDSNVAGIKGVSLYQGKNGTKYRAHICVGGKTRHLGSYDSHEEAHAAYLKAAREHFGEFARAA